MYKSLDHSESKHLSLTQGKARPGLKSRKGVNQFTTLNSLYSKVKKPHSEVSYAHYNNNETIEGRKIQGSEMECTESEITFSTKSEVTNYKNSVESEEDFDGVKATPTRNLSTFSTSYTDLDSYRTMETDYLESMRSADKQKIRKQEIKVHINDSDQKHDFVNPIVTNMYIQNAKSKKQIPSSNDNRLAIEQSSRLNGHKASRGHVQQYSSYNSYKPVVTPLYCNRSSTKDGMNYVFEYKREGSFDGRKFENNNDELTKETPHPNLHGEKFKAESSLDNNDDMLHNDINEQTLCEYKSLVDNFSNSEYQEAIRRRSSKKLKLKASRAVRNQRIQSEYLKYEFIFDAKDYDKYTNLSYTEELDPEYLSKNNVTFKKTKTCSKLSISGKKVLLLDIIHKKDILETSSRLSILFEGESRLDEGKDELKSSLELVDDEETTEEKSENITIEFTNSDLGARNSDPWDSPDKSPKSALYENEDDRRTIGKRFEALERSFQSQSFVTTSLGYPFEQSNNRHAKNPLLCTREVINNEVLATDVSVNKEFKARGQVEWSALILIVGSRRNFYPDHTKHQPLEFRNKFKSSLAAPERILLAPLNWLLNPSCTMYKRSVLSSRLERDTRPIMTSLDSKKSHSMEELGSKKTSYSLKYSRCLEGRRITFFRGVIPFKSERQLTDINNIVTRKSELSFIALHQVID